MVAIFQGTGHVYVNPAAVAMMGYSREELLHRSFIDYVHPDFRQMVMERRRARQRGEDVTSRYEIKILTKDGTELWVDFTAAPIEYDGKPAILGVGIDITERKEMEARPAAGDGSGRSRQPRQEHVPGQHEPRNPHADERRPGHDRSACSTPISTREQRQYLETARDSAESLLAIINDILDFSKIEAGKLELEAAPFRPARHRRRRHSLAGRPRPHAGDRAGLPLRPGRSGSRRRRPRAAAANPGQPGRQRHQVHAAGRSRHGRPLGRRLRDGHVTLQFSVTDTGIGIPQDKLESIFNAFEQADGSMTRRYGGTGLGLAISSRLIELMDGKIWVESRVGQGSTFHFTATLRRARRGDGPPAPRSSRCRLTEPRS